jgi:hypothetical protein
LLAKTKGEKMRIEIDPVTFAVKIYDEINAEPFWYQPDYPNGDKFDSFEEAEEWAKLAVKSHDPDYGYFAPNGKGLDGEAKPSGNDIAVSKLANIGLTVEDLKTLLGI